MTLAGKRLGVVAVCTLLGLATASAAVPATSRTAASTIRIVFTGEGGGRYLDITRWLHEDTRSCFARQTEDQQVHVAWRLAFSARVVRRGDDWSVVSARRDDAKVEGTIDGQSVRDSCDSAEVDPAWGSTTTCEGDLGIRSQGSLSVRPRGKLHLIGPTYESLPGACDTEIRNDQLQTQLPLDAVLSRALQANGKTTISVGTRHPGPGNSYVPTLFCSAFPHIYEGVVYLYNCQDTLIWNGTVSITHR
jgi:hypothetical protein